MNFVVIALIISNILLLVDTFMIRALYKKTSQDLTDVINVTKKTINTNLKIIEYNASLINQNKDLKGEK